MGPGVDRLAEIGPAAILAAALWSGLMALTMIGCRQPARRISLGRLMFLGLLALGPVLVMLPPPRIPALDNLVLKSARTPMPAISAHRDENPPVERSGIVAGTLAGEPRAGGLSRPRLLVIAYGAGVSACLAWLALGWLVAGRLVRESVEPRPFTRRVDAALPYQGCLKRPALRVSRHVRRPVLVGFWNATILIPPRLEHHAEVHRLRLSLSHELAHAERLDGLSGLVAGLAQAVWFVLPQVWWVGAQMRIDQEFLADRRATLRLGTTTARYASTLMDVAAPGRERPPSPRAADREPPHQPRASGPASAMVLRMLMLLRCPFAVEGQTPLWWRVFVPPVGLCGVVMLSALSLQSADLCPALGSRAAVPAPRRIQVPTIHLACDHSRSDDLTCVLPILLPPHFELTFEILTRRLDLPLYAFAGTHVVPELDEEVWSGPQDEEAWHHIRLRRSPDGTIQAWINASESRTRPQRGDDAPRHLAIHAPPGRTARLRDLNLTW